MQMMRTDVLKNTIHAAFEDAEKAFDRIGVGIAAHVFASRVIDRLMVKERLADFLILARIIGHQARALGDVLAKFGFQRVGGHIGHMERAHLAAALDQRENRFLMRVATAFDRSGLRPIKVSSASTVPPLPPSMPRPLGFIASRIRCAMNHAVL